MAHQVADLVDQFVRLDAFLMDFIFEAAMKLASLTDGQLFLMLETSEGRRFAGKDHLCDLYMSGRLQPVGCEVKYHLDNFNPNLVKEFIDSSTTAAYNQRPHAAGPANGSSTPSRTSLKRRGGDASGAMAKSPRLSSTLDSPSTLVDHSSSTFSASTNAEGSSSAAASTVKRLDFKQEVAEEITLLDDDDDQGGGGGGGVIDENDLNFAAVEFHIGSADGSTSQPRNHQIAQRPHHFEMDPAVAGTAFDESHDSVIHKFLDLNPKAQTVSSLPFESFLTKDSPSLKLLHSLGYDYCKHMASFCPTDEQGNFIHRSFFRDIFEAFWAQFPNLNMAHVESVANKGNFHHLGGVTLKTKIRSKLYSFFLKPIARKQGKGSVNGGANHAVKELG